MSIQKHGAVFFAVGLVIAYLLSVADHALALSVRSRLLNKRKVKLGHVKGRGRTGESDALTRLQMEVEQSTFGESVAFAILYNNVFFLLAFVILAFYIFGSLDAIYNYIFSLVGSAGLVFLIASGQRE